MQALIILILILFPLSARAIIPLELVAEFELPFNPELWDVQRWMDEDSYGYAYMSHDTVYYVPRIGDQVQFFVIPQSLFDSAGWGGPSYEALHIHRMGERPTAPILSLAVTVWEYSLVTDHTYYNLFLVFDLDQRELLYSKTNLAGHFSNSDGWNRSPTTLWIESWPPPPTFPSKFYRQNREISDFEGPGTDQVHTSYYTTKFVISEDSLIRRNIPGLYDVFSASDGDLAILDVDHYRTEDGDVYGSATAGMYVDLMDSLFSNEICNWPCIDRRPIAFNTAFGVPSFVSRGVVVDLNTLSLSDTLQHWGEFALRIERDTPELMWWIEWNDGIFFHALDPESLQEDSTFLALYGGTKSILKRTDGTGDIVFNNITDGQLTRIIQIFRPNAPISVELQPSIPINFQVFAFPNPFNPTTTLSVTLQQASKALLKIHDVLGREVERINLGHLQAGTHQLSVGKSEWPSGIYLATIEAGARTSITKLMLVK